MNGVGGAWGGGRAARAIQAPYNEGIACVKVGQSKLEMFQRCKAGLHPISVVM